MEVGLLRQRERLAESFPKTLGYPDRGCLGINPRSQFLVGIGTQPPTDFAILHFEAQEEFCRC